MRLAFRLYKNGKQFFSEEHDVPDDKWEDLAQRLGEKHARKLFNAPRHMVEIEFLDEPDPLQRFFRFGTDMQGMVNPVKVSLVRRKR